MVGLPSAPPSGAAGVGPCELLTATLTLAAGSLKRGFDLVHDELVLVAHDLTSLVVIQSSSAGKSSSKRSASFMM